MSNLFLKRVFLVGVFGLVSHLGFSQKTMQLDINPDLKVSGTSTLHDWEMPSKKATGTIQVNEEAGKVIEIKSMIIDMPAESISSGKKAMDKKAYEALKTDKYKNVKFTLKSATKTGDVWTLVGTFNIAGVAKSVTIKAKEVAGNAFGLTGSYAFKLSDYNITPPTAMMGTVKTGDDVKISFNVKFK